jgi:hypothetical protein
MTSRLGSYLGSQKLAKMLLIQAKEEVAKGKFAEAVRDLVKAMEYQMVANNNLANLAFEKRRKSRS